MNPFLRSQPPTVRCSVGRENRKRLVESLGRKSPLLKMEIETTWTHLGLPSRWLVVEILEDVMLEIGLPSSNGWNNNLPMISKDVMLIPCRISTFQWLEWNDTANWVFTTLSIHQSWWSSSCQWASVDFFNHPSTKSNQRNDKSTIVAFQRSSTLDPEISWVVSNWRCMFSSIICNLVITASCSGEATEDLGSHLKLIDQPRKWMICLLII